jgi:hypothetical protein
MERNGAWHAVKLVWVFDVFSDVKTPTQKSEEGSKTQGRA